MLNQVHVGLNNILSFDNEGIELRYKAQLGSSITLFFSVSIKYSLLKYVKHYVFLIMCSKADKDAFEPSPMAITICL